MKSVRAPLDDPDLVVQTLDETERGYVLRPAASGDPVPVSFDHGGELLKETEASAFERFPPVFEEPPRPSFPPMKPNDPRPKVRTQAAGRGFPPSAAAPDSKSFPRYSYIPMPKDIRSEAVGSQLAELGGHDTHYRIPPVCRAGNWSLRTAACLRCQSFLIVSTSR